MARETMKAKIERLENQIANYEQSLQKANKIILDMQEKANETYSNSTDRMQLEHEIEQNRAYKNLYERLKDEHEKLKKDYKQKSEQITELNNKNIKLLEEITLKEINIKTLESNMNQLRSEKGLADITKQAEELKKVNMELRHQIQELQVLKDIKGKNVRGAGRSKTIKSETIQKVKEQRSQGMSMKKIAEIQGISVGSVYNILKN